MNAFAYHAPGLAGQLEDWDNSLKGACDPWNRPDQHPQSTAQHSVQHKLHRAKKSTKVRVTGWSNPYASASKIVLSMFQMLILNN